MPRLKIYVVTMKDGSEITVKAYTHQHAIVMAETTAIVAKWKGAARIAATAKLLVGNCR